MQTSHALYTFHTIPYNQPRNLYQPRWYNPTPEYTPPTLNIYRHAHPFFLCLESCIMLCSVCTVSCDFYYSMNNGV